MNVLLHLMFVDVILYVQDQIRLIFKGKPMNDDKVGECFRLCVHICQVCLE